VPPEPEGKEADPKATAALMATAESPKLSYTIKEVRNLVGISNTMIYRAISNRELRAVKFGSKTLILAKDLHDWLGSLPAMR
jgi:excisionase family DNA binding protein